MGQNDDKTVRFNGLKSGVYAFGVELDDAFFESFENEEIKGGKVHFDINLERTAGVMMFTFVFDGEVTTVCDRCLGAMTVRVKGDDVLNVRFSDTETTDDENTVILPEQATEIDLSPWLYEYVAVRLPLQHTHPDGECDPEMVKYLVDEEAKPADGYVDPRWEALKKVLND